MSTVAIVVLGVLGLIVWDQWRAGTLGQWGAAKFLNRVPS